MKTVTATFALTRWMRRRSATRTNVKPATSWATIAAQVKTSAPSNIGHSGFDSGFTDVTGALIREPTVVDVTRALIREPISPTYIVTWTLGCRRRLIECSIFLCSLLPICSHMLRYLLQPVVPNVRRARPRHVQSVPTATSWLLAFVQQVSAWRGV